MGMRGALRSLAAFCAGTVAILLPSACPSLAQTTNWTGGTGSWFTAGNWSNGIPGASDTATIGNGGTAQINAAASVQTLNIYSFVANRSTVDLQVGGSLSASNGIFVGTGPAPGTLTLSGSTNVTGPITLANAIIQSNVTGTLSNSITIDRSYGAFIDVAAGTTLTLAGPISGGSLVITGGGTTIYAGTDTSTGGTVIQSGASLRIGNGGTSGTIGSGSVGNYGALIFNRRDSLTVANVIDGSGTIEIASGTLIYIGTGGNDGLLTIDPGATLQLGNGTTGGTLISLEPILNNGTLIYNQTFNIAANNSISGTGSLIKTGTGIVSLTGVNTYSGGTTISGGTLEISNIAGLGSGAITLGGTSALRSTVSGTLTNDITFAAGSISTISIPLAHTLTLTGSWTVPSVSSSTVIFGSPTDTGTIILAPSAALVNLSLAGAVEVAGGTLQTSMFAISGVAATSVDAGAVLDFSGTQLTSDPIYNLLGAGTVVTNATTPLVLGQGSFSGKITGAGQIEVGPLCRGPVGFPGGCFTHTTGIILLSGASDYSGGTNISAGTIQVGNMAALGTGAVTLDMRGNLSAVVSGMLTNDIILANGGGGTISAAPSQTFILASNSVSLGTSGMLTFGTVTDTGTIVFQPATATAGLLTQIAVDGGTLRAGNSRLNSLVSSGFGLFVNTGATVDLNGFSTTVNTLFGGGQVQTAGATLSVVDGQNFTGVITGTGVFHQLADAPSVPSPGGGTRAGFTSKSLFIGANTYTGGTIIDLGGALQLGNGGTSGSIVGNVQDNGALIVNRSDTYLFGGIISGMGSLTNIGTGTLILTAANAYTGGTTISAGTLQIGNGGTSGSIAGDVADNGALIFNRSDAVTFAGTISGTGSVAQAGGGTLTLSGTSTYSGATFANAGMLNVTGKIASSSVKVANGATLSGTGTVGSTTIQSGGALSPGNSIGTLTVNGNLTLASGAIYNVEVSATAADRVAVSGTASINGNVVASIASGTYSFGQRFTLINAAGGVSGTFASLTGIPISLKGQLSYDTNNAYLTLSPNALAPLLSNPTGNQQKVVSAIDAAVAAGSVPPGGFVALYGLSGPALNSALDQISGQIGPNVTNAVGRGFLSFMSMMAGGGSGETSSFAPGSAYGGADAPHRAQLGTGETRVWGAAYGGHVGLSGDSASGAAGLSSNNVGMIGGADMKVADGLLAGVTLGMGRQLFHSGNGSGDSNDFMFGLYGRADAGAAYVAASFGFGWHQIKTLRIITVSGTDVLQGKQNADDVGGRIEAGWHLPIDDTYTVTPYAAFAGESFESPAYTETALSGASTFALSYAARTFTPGRSELGAHLDRNYALEHGNLTAGIRAAWAHQLDDLPFTQASFIALPGAAFQTVGVRPARDTALLGLDLEVQNSSGLFFGIHGEGQFGAGTTMVEGLGNLGWRW